MNFTFCGPTVRSPVAVVVSRVVQLMPSREPTSLTLMDGAPVVLTCQENELGREPPDVTSANDVQPPAKPGLIEVAVVMLVQEDPTPPAASGIVV